MAEAAAEPLEASSGAVHLRADSPFLRPRTSILVSTFADLPAGPGAFLWVARASYPRTAR